MLDLDHIAITVDDLDKSISFYTKIGYQVVERFHDEDYDWATLKLNNHSLELFQVQDKKETIEHIAYSYDFDDEVIDIIQRLGYSEQVNLFYGDLNRKSFFIKDPNGKSIQFIKK